MRTVAIWGFGGLAVACGGSSPVVDHPTLEQPHPTHARGAFGVYVGKPRVDPFPDAPDASGWGSRHVGDRVTHLAFVSGRPDETSADAVARRGMPAAQLPADAKLVYAIDKPYPHVDEWAFTSVVVASAPVLTAADVTCSVVERPNVVIHIGQSTTESGTWPYLALTWAAPIRTRLEELVASDPDVELYVAYGDDIVDDWLPGKLQHGTESVELEVPGPDAETARALAAALPCAQHP